MTTEKLREQILTQTAQNTSLLLDFCRASYDRPVEALMALILGSGSLARHLGMSRQDLLEGVGKAWDCSSKAGIGESGKGADHVH